MADSTHVEILKRGVKAWKEWRQKNPAIKPDLRDADLAHWDLTDVDFNLALVSGANLYGAKLVQANLSRANFNGADLSWVDLTQADLSGADLEGAELYKANFSRADFNDTNFSDSMMFCTQLGTVDLSSARGLETVRHKGPSMIGIDTIYLSKGNIPEKFLHGAGVPEQFLTYQKSLVVNPIEYYSCFISYSNRDEDFANRLYANLQREHVQCYFAPEDLKIGHKLRPQIDEAIRSHDKLLLILSKDSVESAWVEKEVETAFEMERRQRRPVLFPIRLDESVMETDQAWAADVRRMGYIGNFRNWKDHDQFSKAFDRLLRDLKAENKAKVASARAAQG